MARTVVISNAAGTSGLARTLGVNTVSIAAKFPANGISASTKFQVRGPELVSISIAPKTVKMPLGKSRQFSASGTYTDNSARDISEMVIWTSSDENIVSISTDTGRRGIAKGRGLGAVYITAIDPTTKITGTAGASEDNSKGNNQN